MWRKGDPLALLERVQTGTVTVESSLEITQRLRMDLPFDSAAPLLGIYPKGPKTNSKEHKHHYVHCSIIYNHQDREAAQVSINRWLDKTTMGHYIIEYDLAIQKRRKFYPLQQLG